MPVNLDPKFLNLKSIVNLHQLKYVLNVVLKFRNLHQFPSGVISEYVNPYLPTYTPEEYWSDHMQSITRLTAHFVCGLMSDLVIWKFRRIMVIHDTECPYWDHVSLNNTNQTICINYNKPVNLVIKLFSLKLHINLHKLNGAVKFSPKTSQLGILYKFA